MRRALVGTLILLAACSAGYAAVAVTGTPVGTSSSGSNTLTLSVTVPAGTSLMMIHCQFSNIARTVTGMTVDESSSGVTAGTRKAGTTYGSIETYYKVSPTAGTYNVVGTWNTSGQCVMQVVLYSGVNTSSPFGTPVSAEQLGDVSLSATCSSATGGIVDIILGIASGSLTPTDNSGQVSRKIDVIAGNALTGASSTEVGAASVTSGYTWTPSQSAQIILTPINPAPSVPKTKLMTLLGVGE